MFYFGLFIVLIGADQILKLIALKYFSAYVLINTAGPFSIKGGSYLFAVASLVIMAVFLLLIKRQFSKNKSLVFPVVLIISGGISNVIDRVARRGVVDFIDLKIWPSFNFADILISLGIILVILNEVRKIKKFSHSSSRSLRS